MCHAICNPSAIASVRGPGLNPPWRSTDNCKYESIFITSHGSFVFLSRWFSEDQFFYLENMLRNKWKCVQNCPPEKEHLPRMLHVLRLIHSDSEFDFEVLIGAVFGDCHFVPL